MDDGGEGGQNFSLFNYPLIMKALQFISLFLKGGKHSSCLPAAVWLIKDSWRQRALVMLICTSITRPLPLDCYDTLVSWEISFSPRPQSPFSPALKSLPLSGKHDSLLNKSFISTRIYKYETSSFSHFQHILLIEDRNLPRQENVRPGTKCWSVRRQKARGGCFVDVPKKTENSDWLVYVIENKGCFALVQKKKKKKER